MSRAVTEQASPPPLRAAVKAAVEADVIRDLIQEAEKSRQPVLATVIAVAATTDRCSRR